jgi:hypothetical protein
MIDIFIPSYKRAQNIKTAKFIIKIGYDAKKLHVVIDDECGTIDEYRDECDRMRINLHIVNYKQSIEGYDYIHRQSASRRSAGQFRNMFYDIAKKKNIKIFMIQDDDTTGYEIKRFGRYLRIAKLEDILYTFDCVVDLMKRHNIGIFGIPQTGDFIGGKKNNAIIYKVMNTTFVNTDYMYKGERGVQDDDTSQFVSIYNNGLFTGSLGDGLVLKQMPSATQEGGLTELYNECKLLNKSLITPIQFPSCISASRQANNGGRLHHRINNKYLMPRIIKGKRNNIAWDSYIEDIPFSVARDVNTNGVKK